VPYQRHGFDAVLGNPPWKQDEVSEPDFWASVEPSLLDAGSVDRQRMLETLKDLHPEIGQLWSALQTCASILEN